MVQPRSCLDCQRRAQLLALLAPYIERHSCGGFPASGSIELLALANQELAEAAAPKIADQLIARIGALSESRLNEELATASCWATCRHDDTYPAGLRDTDNAPWAIFGRGDAALFDGLLPAGAVTVVGARRATAYGRQIARELGSELAAAGLIVLSGLAFGVDGCAHRGALDAEGRTIAVLPGGPDVAYPAAHCSLWRRISEVGLLISEFPPGAAPWRWTFPARNRIMAAISQMTVVVEAAACSGSMGTAAHAADLGRDLGAVPGPVTSRLSAGPNALIADGARLVRDAEDVLDAIASPSVERIEG